MSVSERQAERAVVRKSGAESASGVSRGASAVNLTPAAAWSRRVRWIGGLIQAAFAGFWLVRGSAVIGGGVAVVLIAVFGAVVIGVFVYAIRAAAGIAPRPKSPEGRRIERDVTIATVLEFVAAIVLPVVVSSAGHSDWVLPSIAITIGPLLLWLDHRVDVPRYRPVGWALTVGPVILVATMSGTPLIATTGMAAAARHCRGRLPGPRGSPTRRGAPRRQRGCVLSRSAAMSQDRLQVVFGFGQVGSAVTARLAALGLPVRVVSRSQPSELGDGVDWRAADATDAEAASDAANGASVVYQCLNAPYTDWPERFPPLQRGVLAAAERSGALLVSLENLYGYGPTRGRAMTEDLPLAATTVKGRTRAAMTQELLDAAEAGRVRIAIGRASDFFGAGVTESSLGERVFANAVAGKRADFVGNPNLPHTYSYIPDIAAGLATLGTDERAVGGVWHLPGPETATTREILDLVAGDVGHPVGVRSLPKLAVRALGLFNPTIRELIELSYEFDAPFVLDTTKYESTFSAASTPLSTAISATVAWYQSRNSTRHPQHESTEP